MSTPLAARISEEFGAVAAELPAAVVAPQRRREAVAALAAEGLPAAREENWKYANLRPLERARFAPLAPRAGGTIVAADLPAGIRGYARYTFVDGVFAPALSSSPEAHAGVTVRSPSTGPALPIRDENGFNRLARADARFAWLNEAFAVDAARVHATAGTQCPACLEILFVATTDGQSGASHPRLELDVEPGARLGLIERHLSLSSDASFVNNAVTLAIGRGACVDHYRVQQVGSRAIWIDTLAAGLAEDAEYRLYMVGLGALSARSTVHVRLEGRRAQLGLHAVSVADRHQVHDFYALVEHLEPHTRTEESFRGIAAGRSRVAFNGKIIVREGANGVDSRQSLRGLLAGAEAEIDVRPQLEIYTDDVRCSHGATAGKLDETMLFYLLSRGLDRETAQRLLKWAFLEDVVAKIAVPELRRQIEQSLAGQMNESTVLEELL